jgi:hypothetical protein
MAVIEELTKYTVLVPMLHRILFGYDHLEIIDWTLPPSSHDQTHSQMDHLLGYEYNSLDRHCLLFRHYFPMYTNRKVLECTRGWLLRARSGHHRPHFPLQRLRNHIGLHLCNTPHFSRMGTEYAGQDTNHVDSRPRHGLRVSLL